MIPRQKDLRTWLASALVLTYVVVASAYGVIVPAWEAPDEPAHFDYVEQLTLRHSLPVDHPGALGEEHQPPLYYLISVIATLPANLTDPYRGSRVEASNRLRPLQCDPTRWPALGCSEYQ